MGWSIRYSEAWQLSIPPANEEAEARGRKAAHPRLSSKTTFVDRSQTQSQASNLSLRAL